MKNFYLIPLFLFSFGVCFSQTPDSLSVEEQQRREKNIQARNPFEKFGYKPKISTLSKGKYLEFHDQDSIVQIGSFTFHVKKKIITGYILKETMYSEAALRPEVVSRWFSPDPLSAEFPSWSPYNFVMNNPIRFTDPTGLAPEDIIRTNKEGYITSVEKADGDHIVLDHNGDRLIFNDPSFDNEQLNAIIGEESFRYKADWNGTDKTKLFTSVSNKNVASLFNSINIGSIKKNLELATKISFLGPPLHMSREMYIGNLGHGSFDFADNMAFTAKTGGNFGNITLPYPEDGTGGFLKFGNSKTLFNIYDSGNFLTGKAFNMIGLTSQILQGANLNSIITGNGSDSEADQRALTNGINYNGIRWRN